MNTPADQDLSILAQRITNDKRLPTFTFPLCQLESDSPIFRTSLESVSSINSFEYKEAKRLRKCIEPIFPPVLDDTYIIPLKPLGIFSAEPWPISFAAEEWESVWNTESLQIDSYLRRATPSNSFPNVTREDQFNGAPWRITINQSENVTCLPTFKHRMAISYHNSNRQDRHYIIDHCAFQDETTACLRVVCYVSRRKVLGAHTPFPPFILAIPKEYCQARTHPDFDLSSFIQPRLPTPEPSIFSSNILPSCFSAHQEEAFGWKEKLLQLLLFWKN